MGPKQTGEYLVGDRMMEMDSKRAVSLRRDEEQVIRNLSNKERALRFNGFVVTDERGEIIFEDRKRLKREDNNSYKTG